MARVPGGPGGGRGGAQAGGSIGAARERGAAKVEASGRSWRHEVAPRRATRGDGECSGERGRGRRREHRKPIQARRERWTRDSSSRPAEGNWEQAAGARQSGGDRLGRLITGVRGRAGSVSQRPVAERKKKSRAACGGDCGDAWPFATAIQTTTATQHQSFKTT